MRTFGLNLKKITMKILVKEEKKIEIDIPIPYYTKTSYFVYKVFSEDHCIQVYSGSMCSIQQTHAGLAFLLEYEITTKEVFEAEFNRVYEILKAKALEL